MEDIHTSYLKVVFNTKIFKKRLGLAIKILKELRKEIDFDAIAFTGTSGSAFSFPLSVALKIPLMHIRKEGASSHFDDLFEGYIASKRYIIVDDFISSGASVGKIQSQIKTWYEARKKVPPKLVGMFLYEDDGSNITRLKKDKSSYIPRNIKYLCLDYECELRTL